MQASAKRTKTDAAQTMNLKAVCEILAKGENVPVQMMKDTVQAIANGQCEPIQIGAFLSLLKAKGETAEEVTALVQVMLSHSVKPPEKANTKYLDIVGTGGDGFNTVNISTTAAVVCAALGATVAKHGNRSVSSKSGSADVLEVLGVPMLEPTSAYACLETEGVSFLYAPHFHPAMKYVAPVRKALGMRTVFNILGPLLNPAGAKRVMIGTYKPELLELMGQVFYNLGVEHGLVVHCCGMDELAPIGIADAVEVTQEKGVVKIQIDPFEMGIPKCTPKELEGGDAEVNATMIKDVLSGKDVHGDIARTIALNSGAGMYVYGSASTIKEGYEMSLAMIKSGKVMDKLGSWSKTATELHAKAASS